MIYNLQTLYRIIRMQISVTQDSFNQSLRDIFVISWKHYAPFSKHKHKHKHNDDLWHCERCIVHFPDIILYNFNTISCRRKRLKLTYLVYITMITQYVIYNSIYIHVYSTTFYLPQSTKLLIHIRSS